MRIEVANNRDGTTKQKGDLLESLSKKLLESQGYTVTEEIRVVGAELDLLCKHKVNGKKIYVECKAQKDLVSAPILRQLWGTVDSQEYSEGWIISTSDFSKDAKGFIEDWQRKPTEKSARLSFYSPKTTINALIDASVVSRPPHEQAAKSAGGDEFIGEWTLLISPFGMFWCVYTLRGGTPFGVLVYNAKTTRPIQDDETLSKLANLDTPLADFDVKLALKINEKQAPDSTSGMPVVIEVQTGDSWSDYRPARPQDFVGRDSAQLEILGFLQSAKNNKGSRVFAITGNSGLGKSSLIAKIRDRSKNKRHKNKFFVYAVDIRGARSPLYILSALISCIKEAQKSDFGDQIEISLTDPTAPLNSASIQQYLDSIERRDQVICLIFDQFEELYSKPELFGIFKAAKDLMLDVAGSKRNFVLGFAWKTDSTTQQDHPAYHMWHELADHRREYRLEVFDSGEIAKSITVFEKQIGHKITAETRHQITHSCQGFPWLLKKLCINIFEGINKGEDSDSIFSDLDAGRLFEADVESLTQQERSCLKLIAQKAPADWSEIIEISGIATLNNLVHRRLVIRSGDRLNIYWDIFKDYLLTGKVPVIPFNYIPTSDPSSLLNVCRQLLRDTFLTAPELGARTSRNERTIWNIGADLVMLGLAERDGTSFKLHRNMPTYSDEAALKLLRLKLDKHSLKISLYKKYAGKTIQADQLKDTLVSCLPKAKFEDKTWAIYSNRLINLLIYVGFLTRAGYELVVQDSGAPVSDFKGLGRRGSQRGSVFSSSVSPYSVVETIQKIQGGIVEKTKLNRNALAVLKRFELISTPNGNISLNSQAISKFGGPKETLWSLARNDKSIRHCVNILIRNKELTPRLLAETISEEYKLKWSEGSIKRNGGILWQWAGWIKEGLDQSEIPPPPGRQVPTK